MKLCEHCIRGIRSREPLYVGPMVVSAEEAEEENTPCEWCGEFEDLYECEKDVHIYQRVRGNSGGYFLRIITNRRGLFLGLE